jgi:hypothetical protein
MAHYIVLTATVVGSERTVNGLAYTAVPGGNNAAGEPWADVVRAFLLWRNRRYGTTLQATIPVDPATQAELDAGTLFEWRWNATFPTSHTNPQAIAAIETAIEAQEAAEEARLADLLRYWGFEGDSS